MHHEAFIKFLQAEKNYSFHTLRAYQSDLKQFFLFLSANYSVAHLSEVTPHVVRSWLADLIQTGVSPRSAKRKLIALKTYFHYLERNKLIENNPVIRVSTPRSSQTLPVFIEKAKLDYLLDNDFFDNDLSGKRDRLVLELLYSSGIRVSELVDLRHRDVDFSQYTIRIHGKRNKQRILPVSAFLIQLIEKYMCLKEKQFGAIDSDAQLIVSSKGKEAYPRLIYNIVNKYLSLVTTKSKKSPHVLRHSFATALLNNGAELNAIKELLGHANLAATQVYTHNTIDRIKHIYQQAHPKA